MKKFLAILLSMVMLMSLAACGSGSAAEYYSGEVDWVEAGYEGDCIITNHVGLVLNGDGTYTLEDAFLVNQVSGAIVFYTKTFYTGKYTAEKADADGIKTVSLQAPTSAVQNLNGVVATSAEDADILPSFQPDFSSIQVDTNSHAVVSTIPQHQ